MWFIWLNHDDAYPLVALKNKITVVQHMYQLGSRSPYSCVLFPISVHTAMV